MNLDLLGGRKFILAVLVVLVSALLVVFHRISDGVFSAVVIATVGAFIGGNVAQTVLTQPKTESKT